MSSTPLRSQVPLACASLWQHVVMSVPLRDWVADDSDFSLPKSNASFDSELLSLQA